MNEAGISVFLSGDDNIKSQFCRVQWRHR